MAPFPIPFPMYFELVYLAPFPKHFTTNSSRSLRLEQFPFPSAFWVIKDDPMLFCTHFIVKGKSMSGKGRVRNWTWVSYRQGWVKGSILIYPSFRKSQSMILCLYSDSWAPQGRQIFIHLLIHSMTMCQVIPFSTIKNQGSLRKKADSIAGAGKVQIKPGTLCCARK